MSDLLNSASLVMIPSGYKEDTVFSAIPTDGSGDLSFTRASNGTRVNSAGLVEVVAWNLVQQSETFDNAYWQKFNTTVSTNTTTAPNGTTTADTITEDTSTTRKILYTDTTIVANQEITLTIYVKKNTLQYVRLVANDLVENFRWFGAQFDLTALTYTSATGSNGNATFTSASITDAGNGWYRIAVSGTINTTSLLFGIFTSNGATLSSSDDRGGNTYLGTGKSAYIWGAQLNIGSTAKPYFPTTDRLNVPRLTYQNGGGGCPSLLFEKQSTNLFRYSEQFDDVYWVKARTTITANSIISPDGTQNADVIFPDTSPNTSHELFNNIGTSGVSGWSGFFKFQGQRWIGLFGSGDPIIFYDLQNGVIGNVGAGLSGSITNMGNGWYRCTYIKNSGTNTVWGFGFAESNGSMGIGGTPNTSLGFGIWGFQAEASSYATSYIGPTTTASATRVADACFKTGISSLIGQTEGVLFVDFDYEAKPDLSGNVPMVIYDGSNEAYIFITTSGGLRLELYNGGSLQCLITTSIGSEGRKKIAFAYKQNDFVGYMNGTQIGTDTTGTVGSMTNLYVGSYYSANYSVNGGINESILFPTRLTNAELASLTTI